MSSDIEWLPPLIEKKSGVSDQEFIDTAYIYFKTDFIDNITKYNGVRLALKRHPLKEQKEATFWHMITEGKKEDSRTFSIERCKRIRWPKAIIENASMDIVKIWENTRKGETRVLLWLEQKNYLVILAKRKRYILPWTAYLVEQPHRKRKLEKEYLEFHDP